MQARQQIDQRQGIRFLRDGLLQHLLRLREAIAPVVEAGEHLYRDNPFVGLRDLERLSIQALRVGIAIAVRIIRQEARQVRERVERSVELHAPDVERLGGLPVAISSQEAGHEDQACGSR